MADDQCARDIEAITDQILNELNGYVTHSSVQDVLKEVAPNYENVRIQTFVPIFIHRDAINKLRAMPAVFDSMEGGMSEAESGVKVA